MIASEKEHLLGELQFKCHQKANHFKALTAFVDVVSEEEVVITTDVAVVVGLAPNVKEPHQVNVVAVKISEYLDGRLERLDQYWLCLKDI